MKKQSSKNFDSTKSMCEHIMQMKDMTTQLKPLKMEISKSFLVHFIMNSTPSKYSNFKISYNTHKNEWSVNELLTMCVQEDDRLKNERPESVHVGTHTNGKA